MKKIVCALLTMIIAATSAISLVGCAPSGREGYDANKSQLIVYSYAGGFGTDWLDTHARAFEEFYATTSFENEKEGVQVWVEKDKTHPTQTLDNMLFDQYDVLFTETVSYTQYSKTSFAPITDIVNETLEIYGETRSIADKMSSSQRSFLQSVNGTYDAEKGEYVGDYYAIPHYAGVMGISFDVDLWNQEGYWLNETATNIVGPNYKNTPDDEKPPLSKGVDGISGTYDDGLPATYDEFFKLCSFINRKYVPLCWSGEHAVGYWNYFFDCLVADYEGAEQFRINFDMEGTATHLVDSYQTITSSDTQSDIGKIIDSSMTFKAPTQINKNNGYLVKQQAGRAYALSFYERLINGGYFPASKVDQQVSHTGNQLNYLQSSQDSSIFGKRAAMIMDGDYWYKEADSAFTQCVEKYSDSMSRENRNFGFMPFPKATADLVGKGNVFYDYHSAYGFIKAGLSNDQLNIAKKFLQFCYTDEQLREFTLSTSTAKSLSYDISPIYDDLSSYGKTLASYIQDPKTTLVESNSTTDFFELCQAQLQTKYFWETSLFVGGVIGWEDRSSIEKLMRKEGISAKDIFDGFTQRYDATQWEVTFGEFLG